MIKVISEGRIPPKRRRRFTCTNCGCIFEADYKDYYNYHDDFRNSDFYLIECPTCGWRYHTHSVALVYKEEES